MTFSLQQLQEEQVPWVKHNFGDRAAYQPLLGMTEELGEFCYAVGMMRTQGRAFEKDKHRIFLFSYKLSRNTSRA